MTPRMAFRLAMKVVGVLLALSGLGSAAFAALGLVLFQSQSDPFHPLESGPMAPPAGMLVFGIVMSLGLLGAGAVLLLRTDWMMDLAYPLRSHCATCGRRCSHAGGRTCPECAQGGDGRGDASVSRLRRSMR